MAWNPSPKVADCRYIARKWKKQQIIILAVDIHANTLEYASYGETRALCDEAKKLADASFEAITKEKREKYDAEIARLDAKFEPHLKAIQESERITEEDLKIRINAKS